MSRGISIGREEVTQGKPGAAVPRRTRHAIDMACAAGYSSGENLAWLTYAAIGNIAFCRPATMINPSCAMFSEIWDFKRS